MGSAIGNALFGSTHENAAQEQQQQPDLQAQQYTAAANGQSASEQSPCAFDVQRLGSCLGQNNGDMDVCGWYLQQLKVCKQVNGLT